MSTEKNNKLYSIGINPTTNEATLVPVSGIPPAPIDCDYVKLTKNTKGYQWDIKILAKEGVDILEQIKYTDNKLRKEYGGEL